MVNMLRKQIIYHKFDIYHKYIFCKNIFNIVFVVNILVNTSFTIHMLFIRICLFKLPSLVKKIFQQITTSNLPDFVKVNMSHYRQPAQVTDRRRVFQYITFGNLSDYFFFIFNTKFSAISSPESNLIDIKQSSRLFFYKNIIF